MSYNIIKFKRQRARLLRTIHPPTHAHTDKQRQARTLRMLEMKVSACCRAGCAAMVASCSGRACMGFGRAAMAFLIRNFCRAICDLFSAK